MTMLQSRARSLLFAALALIFTGGARAEREENPGSLLLILDCSASMWNRLDDGRYRIDAAKQVLSDFVAKLPAGRPVNLGLRIYGSRIHFSKDGACKDSVLVVPVGPPDRDSILTAVRKARAIGATPLAASLELAREDFTLPGKKRLVVFTDGEESCGGNLRAALDALRAEGLEVDIHLIGIGLAPDALGRFEALGVPVENATSASALAESFGKAVAPVLKKSDATPLSEKVAFRIRLVKNGEPFTGAVPAFLRQSDSEPVPLKPDGEGSFTGSAPAGMYRAEVRPGGKTFPSLALLADAKDAPREFVLDLTEAPKVSLIPAKNRAPAASMLDVKFSGAPGTPGDYLTIVEKGSDIDSGPSWQETDGASSGTVALRVPGKPGAYEARFYARMGSESVLAGTSEEILVQAPDYELVAVNEAPAAGEILVAVRGGFVPGNYIAMARPQDAPGDYLQWQSQPAVEHEAARFFAPTEPGDYELRLLNETAQDFILAKRMVKITPATFSIEAPASAPAGSFVPVKFTGSAGEQFYLTIVPAGTPEGTHAKWIYLQPGQTDYVVAAPEAEGDAEVRLISEKEENKTIARRPVRLTKPDIAIDAPASANAGTEFSVRGKGPAGDGDYVTIVSPSAGDGEYLSYFYIDSPEKEGTLVAPEEAGTYELRYVTGGGTLLLRRPIKILPAQ